MPFGLWTRVGPRKHKFNYIRQVAPMCPHGRTHWRVPQPCPRQSGRGILANTIEASVCCGDAALYQTTVTICSLRTSDLSVGMVRSYDRCVMELAADDDDDNVCIDDVVAMSFCRDK